MTDSQRLNDREMRIALRIVQAAAAILAVNYLIRFIPLSLLDWYAILGVDAMDTAEVAEKNARFEFMVINAAAVTVIVGMYLIILAREAFRFLTGGRAALCIRKNGHFVLAVVVSFAALGFLFFGSGSFEANPKVASTAHWIRGLAVSVVNFWAFLTTIFFLLDSRKFQARFH